MLQNGQMIPSFGELVSLPITREIESSQMTDFGENVDQL